MQYMYKISCKMDKNFLSCSMFLHRRPTRPPLPSLEILIRPSPGKVNWATLTYPLQTYISNILRTAPLAASIEKITLKRIFYAK